MTSCPKGQFSNDPLVYTPLTTMNEYLDELTVSLKSPQYIKLTRIALGHFSNFCTREGVTHPTDLTRSHILRYQGIVNSNGNWAETYRRQLMKSLRTYLNWCEKVGYIEKNPWVHIKIGHTEKKPNPLTEPQVSALFAEHRRGAFTLNPFHFHRRELLLAVMFTWGLRISEVAALNNSAFDGRADFISSINKGGGTKQLPYPEELKKVYARYAVHRGPHATPAEDALFITEQGERLSVNAIRKVVVDIGRRAGIDLNPHMLRDTAGTTMLNDKIPVERVAKILGHSNTRQTLAYAEVRDQTTAAELARSMNPRLKLLTTGGPDDYPDPF